MAGSRELFECAVHWCDHCFISRAKFEAHVAAHAVWDASQPGEREWCDLCGLSITKANIGRHYVSMAHVRAKEDKTIMEAVRADWRDKQTAAYASAAVSALNPFDGAPNSSRAATSNHPQPPHLNDYPAGDSLSEDDGYLDHQDQSPQQPSAQAAAVPASTSVHSLAPERAAQDVLEPVQPAAAESDRFEPVRVLRFNRSQTETDLVKKLSTHENLELYAWALKSHVSEESLQELLTLIPKLNQQKMPSSPYLLSQAGRLQLQENFCLCVSVPHADTPGVSLPVAFDPPLLKLAEWLRELDELNQLQSVLYPIKSTPGTIAHPVDSEGWREYERFFYVYLVGGFVLVCVSFFLDAFPESASSSLRGFYMSLTNLPKPERRLVALIPSSCNLFEALRCILIRPLQADDGSILKDARGQTIRPFIDLESGVHVHLRRQTIGIVGSIFSCLGDIPGLAELFQAACPPKAGAPARYGISKRGEDKTFLNFDVPLPEKDPRKYWEIIAECHKLSFQVGTKTKIKELESKFGLSHTNGDFRALAQNFYRRQAIDSMHLEEINLIKYHFCALMQRLGSEAIREVNRRVRELSKCRKGIDLLPLHDELFHRLSEKEARGALLVAVRFTTAAHARSFIQIAPVVFLGVSGVTDADYTAIIHHCVAFRLLQKHVLTTNDIAAIQGFTVSWLRYADSALTIIAWRSLSVVDLSLNWQKQLLFLGPPRYQNVQIMEAMHREQLVNLRATNRHFSARDALMMEKLQEQLRHRAALEAMQRSQPQSSSTAAATSSAASVVSVSVAYRSVALQNPCHEKLRNMIETKLGFLPLRCRKHACMKLGSVLIRSGDAVMWLSTRSGASEQVVQVSGIYALQFFPRSPFILFLTGTVLIEPTAEELCFNIPASASVIATSQLRLYKTDNASEDILIDTRLAVSLRRVFVLPMPLSSESYNREARNVGLQLFFLNPWLLCVLRADEQRVRAAQSSESASESESSTDATADSLVPLTQSPEEEGEQVITDF